MESLIAPVTHLDAGLLQPLLEESLREGYRFVQTLLDEYRAGTNRFDTPGAVLLGVSFSGRLIGIGGVHRDPYLQRADVGRVRHVYVLHEFRRHGIGRQLLSALIDHAQAHFTLLTLRTNTPAAAAFYEAIGFRTDSLPDQATHWLPLNSLQDEV